MSLRDLCDLLRLGPAAANSNTSPTPNLVQPLHPAKQNRLSERRFCRDSEEIYDETRYFVHEGIRDVKDFNFVPLPRVTLRQSNAQW